VPLVVLPSEGPLALDLRAAGVEVLIRELAVVRRDELSARGLFRLARRAAADAAWIRRLAARRDVALVHSNTSVVLGGALAARLARVPHVWHVREIYAGFGRAWPCYRRVLLGASDAVVCVSEATAAQFCPVGRPGPAGRVRVVYDGLAADAVQMPRELARAALELAPDVPVVAVLGRVSDWKGQDVLVRALAAPELRERGAVGLVAGDAWPGAEDRLRRVVALAEALGVRERLVLCGFRDDVSEVYGAADVIAVPSTAPDPLPGSAIEACAAGCAVVAAAHGGLPEIVRDGVTGRLVAPGDPGRLARVVASLLDAPQERARLGAAAAADVRARFAPGLLVASIGALYDELLGARVRS
jgi:glycosyltransferase involved in cell wall biosynthesis